MQSSQRQSQQLRGKKGKGSSSQSQGSDRTERLERTSGSRSMTSMNSTSFGSSQLGAMLSERAPEFIQDVVGYLEDNWNLRRLEGVAAALGVGSTLDLSKYANMKNWETIKRKVSAKPLHAAGLVAAGIGAVILARMLISEAGEGRKGKMH